MKDDVRQKLATLIDLLACHYLDSHEVEAVVSLCIQTRSDPGRTLAQNYGQDAAQVARYDPEGVTAFVIFTELEDYFAVSDTVDELHEQIIDSFESPTLPEYPYDDNQFETVVDYFEWLDTQLLEHHPKYCLIEFGQSYTHDFQTILVLRDTVDTIMSLCKELGISAERCPA